MGFHTIKNRLPVILTQTIDILVRSKEEIGEKYGEVQTCNIYLSIIICLGYSIFLGSTRRIKNCHWRNIQTEV